MTVSGPSYEEIMRLLEWCGCTAAWEKYEHVLPVMGQEESFTVTVAAK